MNFMLKIGGVHNGSFKFCWGQAFEKGSFWLLKRISYLLKKFREIEACTRIHSI